MKVKSSIIFARTPFSQTSPVKLASLALLASAALGAQAFAAVTFTQLDPDGRSASAEFDVLSNGDGDFLTIKLVNTTAVDVTEPDQLLSSIYFNFVEGTTPTLSKTGGSVTLPTGSSVWIGNTNVTNIHSPDTITDDDLVGTTYGNGGDVSGEFAFNSGLNGGILGTGMFFGVSANGMSGRFGKDDRFVGPNLDDPDAPNGMNYGITRLLDDGSTGNGGVIASPIIRNSVLIKLKINSTDFNLSNLNDVIFQYGTSSDNPSLGFIPETGGAAALIGLLSCGFLVRSRRKENA